MLVETLITEFPASRRTQRVLVRVPVCVSGEMANNLPFSESTFTVAINPDGALIPLPSRVRKGQRLRLLNNKTGQEEDCVAAFIEPGEEGLANVRVQFTEPHPEFWHAVFPPRDWTPRHMDSKFRRESNQ